MREGRISNLHSDYSTVQHHTNDNKHKLKKLYGVYLSTFSTTLATLAVATLSPSQLHCISSVGTAHTYERWKEIIVRVRECVSVWVFTLKFR